MQALIPALIPALAATETVSDDLVWAGVALLITVVICGLLMLLRWKIRSQGLRDFLGISVAFVILTFSGFAMIIAEKLLG